jgi:hypothetical protein
LPPGNGNDAARITGLGFFAVIAKAGSSKLEVSPQYSAG